MILLVFIFWIFFIFLSEIFSGIIQPVISDSMRLFCLNLHISFSVSLFSFFFRSSNSVLSKPIAREPYMALTNFVAPWTVKIYFYCGFLVKWDVEIKNKIFQLSEGPHLEHPLSSLFIYMFSEDEHIYLLHKWYLLEDSYWDHLNNIKFRFLSLLEISRKSHICTLVPPGV